MRNIIVKVHSSKANLKKKDQLAWKIAEIASDKAKINKLRTQRRPFEDWATFVK